MHHARVWSKQDNYSIQNIVYIFVTGSGQVEFCLSSEESGDVYSVEVSMRISKEGRNIETKTIDFGKLKESQVKGLTDLFSMIAANAEYIKKLTPQFEKLDKSKPAYLQ
jgi:hypothetical protein